MLKLWALMCQFHLKRDLIFLDDVVGAFIKVLEHIENHELNFKTFKVGCGKIISMRNFVSELYRISGSATQLDFGAIDYRYDEIMNSYADIRALMELGWHPTVLVDECIRKILEAYRPAVWLLIGSTSRLQVSLDAG